MTARSARAGERYFHVMSFVFLLTVFAGFARTLYLRPLFEVPEFPAVLLAVHGGIFTLWFLWYFLQTTLVANGRIATHRRMGRVGGGLALAVVMVGLITVYGAVPRRISLGVNIEDSLWPLAALVWTNLGSLIGFAIFATAGIVARRSPATHKRMMLLASISLTPAALTRIGALPTLQIVDSQPLNIVGIAFLTLLALLSSLAVYDRMSRGRLHWVTAWGAPGFFALWLFCLFVVPASPVGAASVRWLAATL